MSRIGGNPDLKGKKGRSGRKSKRDEQLRIDVIEKAWEKKRKKMNDSEATQVVLKDMGEKIKGDPNAPLVIKTITGMNISKDGA